MTKANFLTICESKTVNPKLILENDKLKSFLIQYKNDNTVSTQIKFSTLIDIHF